MERTSKNGVRRVAPISERPRPAVVRPPPPLPSLRVLVPPQILSQALSALDDHWTNGATGLATLALSEAASARAE